MSRSFSADRAELWREGVVFEEARVRVTQRFKHFSRPGSVFVGKTKSSRCRFVASRSSHDADGAHRYAWRRSMGACRRQGGLS
jgi:hypothetical protein